jgi:alpha-galactosidase/6-phospho-beta-glucosidase family protein
MTKYNWDIIKDQFIYGIRREDGTKHYPTIDDIVKMHGCAKGTVGERCSKESWVEERKRRKGQIDHKAQDIKKERKTEQKPIPAEQLHEVENSEQKNDERIKLEAEAIVKSDELFEKTGENLCKLIARVINNRWERMDNNKAGSVSGHEIMCLGKGLVDSQTTVKTAQGEKTSTIGVKLMDVDDEERKLIKQLADDLARQK